MEGPSFMVLYLTANGDDLLWGMATLGFEDYIKPLKSCLTRYPEMEVSEPFFIERRSLRKEHMVKAMFRIRKVNELAV
ncbi:putative transcription factor Hap3/NF-YB family [Helianthus debilis subsp. tardiflorus]